jgi:hypothetical protein
VTEEKNKGTVSVLKEGCTEIYLGRRAAKSLGCWGVAGDAIHPNAILG